MTGIDRHGLDVLPLAQSMSLLRSRPLGRLAYVADGRITVVPVNHLVDGSSIVLRSMEGGKLDQAVLGSRVAFQLDDHDPSRATGWSVLVHGRAVLVEDVEQIERFESELDSWAMQDTAQAAWVRIVPEEVNGRRLRHTA